MNLKRLLIIHAFITLAADAVLVFAPTVIPKTVDMQITPEQYLLCYFLGAGELSLAYLSFFSAKIKDANFLRLVTSSLIVFHASTIVFELYAFAQGIVSSKIFFNVIFRLLIISLFVYYGYYKMPKQKV